MSNKIHVLGIAPYEGMRSIMEKIAADRDDLVLDVYVGDLNKGVEIAQKNFHSNYDVIISRGGTAEMIGQITTIPVIEISLSVYDILRAMKLAENYSDRYAIVGFPGITGSAHLLCDLLQYKTDIFTIHSEEEVQSKLIELKNNGYRMILCDMITNTTAKKLGLNAILITSGYEGIQSAFDQAVKLCKSYAHIRNDNRFLKEIIKGQGQETVVYDSEGNLFFSTLEQDNREDILDMIKNEVEETLLSNSHKFFKNIEDNLYSFTSKCMVYESQKYAVFYFSASHVPMASSKYGITYSNRQEVEEHFFNSFYSVTSNSSHLQSTIEHITHTNYPVMITGESGTGKEQVAGVLYAKSSLCHNPLITINCSLMTEKGWSFLTNHYNSPLNDNNNTIYFRNLDALSSERRKYLLSVLVDINLCKRNRIIFSCVCKPGETTSAECIDYVNTLSCMTIYLPPLRERLDEIPTLSSLYLSTLNINLAKQIIGFEPEALKLLEEYTWPYNYTQFKRILCELSIITTTPYITYEHVESLLKKENGLVLGKNTTLGLSFNLNRSLEEINQEIIQLVLKQTDGNQSAAAKRLGISRTTLWRYLK